MTDKDHIAALEAQAVIFTKIIALRDYEIAYLRDQVAFLQTALSINKNMADIDSKNGHLTFRGE